MKSFATTIQERRATPPVEAPVAPPRPPAPPVAEPTPAAPASPITPARAASDDVPSAKPDEAERPMTLEEEMERLLHDFTIDVSDRR